MRQIHVTVQIISSNTCRSMWYESLVGECFKVREEKTEYYVLFSSKKIIFKNDAKKIKVKKKNNKWVIL